MELKQLASFVAVADRLSFVRAAEALHLSQPALSAQIHQLEQDLGVRLLERNRRVVKLTDAGAVFLLEARDLLARAQAAGDRARKAAQGEIGRLRIAFVFSAALEVVPQIVADFRNQHPGVRLDLVNLRTVNQVQGLLDGSLDIGFLRLPTTHPQLNITIIHSEPFAAILPPGHRLAAEAHFALEMLRDEAFVSYGREWAPGYFDATMRMCAQAGFSPHVVQETSEMYTAIALTAVGVGVAIVPRSVLLAHSHKVEVRQLPESLGVSEIGVATRAAEPSKLVQAFVDLARSHRSQEDAVL
ncbi:LysR substrate-binding domain-containing protein [Paludibaculum fermentans]|uniref:LysR substrate-binding domain-containing protein n=1 Tax=Paludibaculum fermentans TaxID=1473598 RepID=UPI003EBEBF72